LMSKSPDSLDVLLAMMFPSNAVGYSVVFLRCRGS
jgi:hypothetical protein